MADELEILASVSLDLAKSLADIQGQMKTLQAQLQGNTVKLIAELDRAASQAKIDADIKSIKPSNIKITGQVDMSATQQQVKAGLGKLKEQKIKLQGVLDRVAIDKNLQNEMQLPKVETTASVKTEGTEKLEDLRKQIDSTGTSATDMAAK